MSEDNHRADPLLRAIGEMRSELLGWIDGRLEVLRQRVGEAERAHRDSSGTIEEREPSPPSPASPEAPCYAEERGEPTGRRAADDARKRLENLARQLGERLRHSEPPSSSPEPASHDATSKEGP